MIRLINTFFYSFLDGGHHGHSHGHAHSHGHSRLKINSGSATDLGNLEINEVYQQNDCPLDRQTPEPIELNTAKQTTVQLIDKNDNNEAKKLSSQQNLNMRGN